MIFIKEINYKKIWGAFASEDNKAKVGEIFLCSSSNSIDEKSNFSNISLNNFYQSNPVLFGNYPSKDFPLLIKIIAAKSNLSVQVHPNDEQAKRLDNQDNGKNEFWFILNPRILQKICVNLKKETKWEDLEKSLNPSSWKKHLQFHRTISNRFFSIKPGTVHAILKNTILYELQQPSDLTYRLYDYDRLENGSKRELHLSKAKEVIKYHHQGIGIDSKGYLNQVYEEENFGLLISKQHKEYEYDLSHLPFVVITCLNSKSICNGVAFSKYQTAIITKQELSKIKVEDRGYFALAWPIYKA